MFLWLPPPPLFPLPPPTPPPVTNIVLRLCSPMEADPVTLPAFASPSGVPRSTPAKSARSKQLDKESANLGQYMRVPWTRI